MNFVEQSVTYLRDEYLPRMQRAVDALAEEDTWWRPHEGVLSAGNILLHLEGNVRQWILAGLGGQADRRDRGSEFAASQGESAAVLFKRLEATVLEACDVMTALDEVDIFAAHAIQGYETHAFGAIYHIVEHFSWHTGQLVWIAKARGGVDHGISFFDDASLNDARNE